MTIDPEEFEDVLAAQLATQLTEWTIKTEEAQQEKPNTAIVEFLDSERTYTGATGDPRFSRPSAAEATINLQVMFITPRQAARGILANLDNSLMAACAALRESRREEWLFHNFESLEEDPLAEQPVRTLIATIEVRKIIE